MIHMINHMNRYTNNKSHSDNMNMNLGKTERMSLRKLIDKQQHVAGRLIQKCFNSY